MKIVKQKIKARRRKLTATWTIESTLWDDSEIKPVPGEPEIWTILKTPPRRKVDLEQEISDALAKEITAAIDAEILEGFKQQIKNDFST